MTDPAHEPTRKCWCNPEIVEVAAKGSLNTKFNNRTAHTLVFINHSDGSQDLTIKGNEK